MPLWAPAPASGGRRWGPPTAGTDNRARHGSSSVPSAPMGDAITRRIEGRAGVPGLVDRLVALPAADLRSLLLETMRRRAERATPAEGLRRYVEDRFVRPASVDPARLRVVERTASDLLPDGFEAVELSPVAPLGSVAALSGLSQNLAVSTVRASEVVSDSTNVLALECAVRRRAGSRLVRLCAFHRVLRAQAYEDPRLASHFALLGLTTAGRDEGSFAFEVAALAEHIGFYARLLGALGIPADVRVTPLDEALRPRLEQLPGTRIDDERTSARTYYRGASFGIDADGLNLVDGGFTDWTQLLLSDRKERLLVSGAGTERLAAWPR